MLYIAGHVQGLGICGKRKEGHPDHREKKYTSIHNCSLREKDKKKGFATNFYLMAGNNIICKTWYLTGQCWDFLSHQ